MKISNQLKITIVFFIGVLVIITASAVWTSQGIAKNKYQAQIAVEMQKGASDLAYLSSDYFLFQENSQLTQWQTRISSMSDDISHFQASNLETLAMVNNIKDDLDRLDTAHGSVVTYLATAPRDVSVRIIPVFQTMWSRLTVSNQELTYDASQLVGLLNEQSEQLQATNSSILFGLLGFFGVYIIIIYWIMDQRTMKSINSLLSGIEVIGSGNLLYTLAEGSHDEVGDISRAFNTMTGHLREVMASRTELEAEVALRKKAEDDAIEANRKMQVTNDELLALNKELSAQEEELKTSNEELSSANEELAASEEELKTTNDQLLDSISELEKSRSELKDSNEKLAELNISLDLAKQDLVRYTNSLEEMVDERTSELREKEAMLRQAEKMEAVSRMGAMIAHDLRGPLNLIAQSVDAFDKFPDKRERMLRMIKENSLRALKMLEDVRQATREIEPKLKPTDLGALVKEAIDDAKIPNSIKPTIDIEEDLNQVKVDPDILRRVIDNLVGNAVDAMPDGGSLKLSVRNEHDGTVIEVADSGVGISKESLPHIWEPFFTTKSKGIGLGLPFCRRAVEAHGGNIKFVSKPRKGTTFTIKLPTL